MDNSDIKRLKKELIDIPVKLCDKVSRKKYKDTKIPQSYVDDLNFLCEQYNVKLKMIIVKKIQNTHCDYSYGDNCGQIQYRTLRCDYTIEKDICTRFAHELAHHIQATVMLKECKPDKYLKSSFKDVLKHERTAERFAYFIYKHHFKHLGDYDHRSFVMYRSKRDLEWLKKWLKKQRKD